MIIGSAKGCTVYLWKKLIVLQTNDSK